MLEELFVALITVKRSKEEKSRHLNYLKGFIELYDPLLYFIVVKNSSLSKYLWVILFRSLWTYKFLSYKIFAFSSYLSGILKNCSLWLIRHNLFFLFEMKVKHINALCCFNVIYIYICYIYFSCILFQKEHASCSALVNVLFCSWCASFVMQNLY